MSGQNTLDYLAAMEGRTFPPLLLELLLRSGRSYFLKNAYRPSSDTEMVVLRVWDLRAVDVQRIPAQLNEVSRPEDWEDFSRIDPALDQANLWVRADEIIGFVEWHERYWPVSPPGDMRAPIGFFQPPGQ